ncbi:LacI family DNA-binding transcriptional regulator [Sphaerisporangium sp. NPDC005289]|uniref:LacI family DNA-binding transcriptional regulator n=1 Tax=Sphaerisporangium sp. NPDC005289 TaxID=3155247 RepID=UPI0033A38AA3
MYPARAGSFTRLRYNRPVPSKPNGSVRLSDVAAIAGVSISTASKVLNGTDRISEATRARVLAVAERLDFRPNALARSFALGRSRTIGVLTHRATSTFSGPVVIGAVVQLGKLQQAALVFDEDVLVHREITESIRQFQARQIDGLLVIGDGHERRSPSITHHFTVPVTYAFAASDNPEDVVYLPDNEGAGVLATRHLLERGRSRIAHVTGDPSSIAVRLRERGMLTALQEAGLRPAAPTRFGSWAEGSGVRAMRELLDSGAEIDAVFCGNDHIARGVLEVCEAMGLRVPEDVAIVGVDNWEGIIVDQGIRRLTTIDLELRALGELAAANLLADDRTPGENYVSPTLVPGPSS